MKLSESSLLIALVWGLMQTQASAASDGQMIEKALVRTAAARIDSVFKSVAQSTRAIGAEYARVAAAETVEVTEADVDGWRERASVAGNTALFRTWSAGGETPAFQAPIASLYSYNGKRLDRKLVDQLRNMKDLVPVFRVAYESFDFSWVYLTTPDNLMLIYPFVTMKEAVNNDPPTGQVYYQAADFKNKAVGWTLPYVDRVGEGMMITASYPVFRGDDLLGVASRDITLTQLSSDVINDLVKGWDVTAFIVDGRGLAIDASAEDMNDELKTVNGKNGDTALYYRNAASLKNLGLSAAKSSQFEDVILATEGVLSRAKDSQGAIAFEMDGRRVLAAPVKTTGWFVILLFASAP